MCLLLSLHGDFCRSTGKQGLPVLYATAEDVEAKAKGLAGSGRQLAVAMEEVERVGRRIDENCMRTFAEGLRKNYIPADTWARKLLDSGVRLLAFADGLDTGKVSTAQHHTPTHTQTATQHSQQPTHAPTRGQSRTLSSKHSRNTQRA